MNKHAWLTKAQSKAKKHAQSQPLKATYGLNMQAFFEHQITGILHSPTFTWYAPEEIQLLPLSEALHLPQYQAALKTHFSTSSAQSRILSLSQALSSEGIVIAIPESFQESKPCTLTISLPETGFAICNVVIIVGSHSQVTLVTEVVGDIACSHQITAVIEPGAQLNHIALDHSSDNPHFSNHQYYAADDAQLIYLDSTHHNFKGERNVKTFLVGEKSKAQHYHLSFLEESARYDLETRITHQAANTHSGVFVRAVLDDQSHMIYRGLITVEDTAPDSTSDQKEATLLLAPTAKIDAVPMLDISNDQVQCNHSASMSNFDPEKLFYMTSRGLPPQQTKDLLIKSFIQTDINNMENGNLKVWLLDNLDKLLAI